MKTITSITTSFILLNVVLLLCCSSAQVSADDHRHNMNFVQCLSRRFGHNYSSISNLVYTPTNSSYSSVLLFPIWDLRFTSESTPKPQVIVTPEHESQVPPVVLCAKQNGLQVRIRSGGHDFEGLSSLSQLSFVIIDLIKLSDITVDTGAKTAWVQAGALNGALYYRIAEKSPTLGFPAGVGTTLGSGGHFSGGGYGHLLRKYGLAADHVIDARIVDAKGRTLDRRSMGEDLFWAIRGGGGASFGVILAWKLQLVDVPQTVTAFTVRRTLEQNATQLIHGWQYVAPRLPHDLNIVANMAVVQATGRNASTLAFTFSGLFLGRVDTLLPLMQERFPEMGLVREDCSEMSWIQSVLYAIGLPSGTPPEVLLNRTQVNKSYMKRKMDYVRTPVSLEGLEGLLRQYFQPEAKGAMLSFVPYGGRMDEIPHSATPFPHRAGTLYKIMYTVFWQKDDAPNPAKYLNWVRATFDYMTPYVSSSPRSAYLNYRDLDIGVNSVGGRTSYAQAAVWGTKYFGYNFHRLVRVKTRVDPHNFFNYEQSIPTLH